VANDGRRSRVHTKRREGGLVAATARNNLPVETGTELWQIELPAGGQATSMTCSINGKQYLAIAAGGHGKLATKQGDHVLAFALP
jgi:quinoprotein glucose dehydrogenase